MKKSLLLLATLLLTAGCASTATTPQPAPASVEETPVQAAQSNERGNQVAEFGKPVVIMSPDSAQPLVTFTVGAPVEATCRYDDTEPYYPDSKFIQVPTSVTTGVDPQGVIGQINVAMDWEYVGPDGTSSEASTGQSRVCQWEAPSELRPSRKYDFPLILEVPISSAGGVIVHHSASGNNWEWKLPA